METVQCPHDLKAMHGRLRTKIRGAEKRWKKQDASYLQVACHLVSRDVFVRNTTVLLDLPAEDASAAGERIASAAAALFAGVDGEELAAITKEVVTLMRDAKTTTGDPVFLFPHAAAGVSTLSLTDDFEEHFNILGDDEALPRLCVFPAFFDGSALVSPGLIMSSTELVQVPEFETAEIMGSHDNLPLAERDTNVPAKIGALSASSAVASQPSPTPVQNPTSSLTPQVTDSVRQAIAQPAPEKGSSRAPHNASIQQKTNKGGCTIL